MRLALLALSTCITGCTCIGNEMKLRMQPESREVSKVVHNDKARWREAVVERQLSRAMGEGRNPFNCWRALHSLQLRDGDEEPTWIWLAGASEQTSMDSVLHLLDVRWVLAYAKDGHAIAVREEREDSSWTYVALDAGHLPQHCPHWTFGTGESNPFDASPPTTRALNLDILRAAVGNGEHHDETNDTELRAAVSFACAHRDDDALVKAARAAAEKRAKANVDISCLEKE